MNGIGFSELLLIGLILVFVVKPKHIPEVLRTGAKLFQRVQKILERTRKLLDRESKLLTLAQNEARAAEAEKQATAEQTDS